MLRNYFRIAVRNLLKNKAFSAINISGMTIGIASCLMILVYVSEELKYDDHVTDKERVYRIYNIRTGNDGGTNYLPIVPPIFAPTIKEEYPEVELAGRFMDTYGEVLLTIGDQRFYERKGIYCEPEILEILDIELIQGNRGEALSGLNQIMISQSLANTHFPEGDALGKEIMVDRTNMVVSGVFRDLSPYSHLDMEFMISFNTLTNNWSPQRMENWVWQQFFTYIKFKENTDPEALESKFRNMITEEIHPQTKPRGFSYLPYLQRVDDIYLHSSNFEWEIARRGNITSVYALSAAAVFILIVVCLNFINLSTARSLNRVKEVGLRKVVGAQRRQILIQFLGESVLIALISMLLAGVIVELTLPVLSGWMGKEISFGFFQNPLLFIAIGTVSLILGVLAGIYPAIFASKFRPIALLTRNQGGRSSKSTLRKVMVLIQFSLSIFLIISALVIYQQLNYVRTKDLGFSKDQLVLLPIRDNVKKNSEVFKNDLLSHPGISGVTYCFGLPGQIVAGDDVVKEETIYSANLILVDYDYLDVLDMDVVAGRAFSEDFVTDRSSAFMINETAVDFMGFSSPEDAIGEEIEWSHWMYSDSMKTGEIVGVVKDFHFKSLKEELTTTVLHIYPEVYSTVAVRIGTEDLQGILEYIGDRWDEIEPEWPFSYEFIDESFGEMYRSEERLSSLFGLFTGLGIFITCLGLFGLISYTTLQRQREIGIRKVLGANVGGILMMINKTFLVMIGIAFLVAVPVSYWLANNWLSSFHYRIELTPKLFITAGLAMVVIALVTVSYQSIRAAMTNPVDVLKDE